MIGSWLYIDYSNQFNSHTYQFKKDGTFSSQTLGFGAGYTITAKYTVSSKNITFTNIVERWSNGTCSDEKKYHNVSFKEEKHDEKKHTKRKK